MIEEKFKLEGTPCQGFRAIPSDGAPRAVMHIVHGLAEHAARYRRLAESLTADGWAVYNHDQRGHGETVNDPDTLGLFADQDGWRVAVDDVGAFVAHEKSQHPGLPFVLFGHSMGSLIVQDYLCRGIDDFAAAVLSGSSGPPPPVAQLGRGVARLERFRLGPRGRSPVLRKLAFEAFNQQFKPNRTAFDWLSRDPAEVDKYVEDPLCGFDATNQFWIDMLDALPRVYRPENLKKISKALPIYIMSGDRDPAGRNGTAVKALAEALRSAGVADVELKLYPDARHELLNETNRDQVVEDLKAWLAKYGLPSAS